MRSSQMSILSVKRNFSIIIYLSLTLFNSSCKKETENTRAPSDTNGSLRGFVLLDTTRSAPNDTLVILKYEYDVNGRCVQSEETLFSSGAESSKSIVRFAYSSGDTLPYKEIATNTTVGRIDTGVIEHFFRYNLANKINFDSFYSSFNNSSTYVNWFRMYSYDNNKVTQAMSFISSPLTPDTSYYLFDSSPGTSSVEDGYENNGNQMYHLTKTYDNHSNPFPRKINPTPFSMIGFSTGGYDYLKQQLSRGFNVTKVEFVDYRFPSNAPPGSPPHSGLFLYAYEYDTQNRPISVVISSKLNSRTALILKGKFFYN